jgi:hypothetical protein
MGEKKDPWKLWRFPGEVASIGLFLIAVFFFVGFSLVLIQGCMDGAIRLSPPPTSAPRPAPAP